SLRVAEALEEGPSPELLVINHASNVTGAIQDLGSIVPLCKKRGTRVLVDCAQTAGRVDLTELGADAYVLPGHKGLMGPPGVGALCLDGAPELLALIEGGTGSSRATDRMPEELPASLEAGTPNTPGYYGWHAGLNWLQEQDPAKLHARELSLLGSLGERLAGLEEEGAVRCFGGTGERHVAILSLSFRDFDPVEVAVILEQHEIIARAGFHCAPYVHRALGTGESGTLRLSPGPFNTEEQIAAVGDVLLQVLKSGH
ncbi:MAG: aminotransferase class V-fold PLP-dependent enzyme, partial [Planctomycetota bacterium]